MLDTQDIEDTFLKSSYQMLLNSLSNPSECQKHTNGLLKQKQFPNDEISNLDIFTFYFPIHSEENLYFFLRLK